MIDLRAELQGRAGFINAAAAMVAGLKIQAARDDFTVNMMVYGDVNNQKSMCFGCAATCAIQEHTGVDFDADNITDRYTRAAAVDVDMDTMRRFEEAIEGLRCSAAGRLGIFCGLNEEDRLFLDDIFYSLPELQHMTWWEDLPKYEAALNVIKNDWGLVTKKR